MPDAPLAPPTAPIRLRLLPLWILCVGLLLTGLLGGWSFEREREQRLQAEEAEARELARSLEHQVQAYIDTLPGLRLFGLLQRSPDDAAFLHYAQAISLPERYPGLAVSFMAELVSEERRASFEAQARADRSVLPAGHPDFRITPPGPRPVYMALRHLYPEDPPAFGYDLYDPGQPYRAAVETAVDTGRYVATGPLQLARDRGKAPDPALTSVVVRAALYQGGITPPTPALRRERALGVVGIGFRIRPLVAAVLPQRLAQNLRLRLVDEQAAAAGGSGLLYDSRPTAPQEQEPPAWTGRLTVADRHWTMTVHRPGDLAGQESTWILLLFGAVLSLALAGMTRTLVRKNLAADDQLRQAATELLAERDQLRRSEARFRMLFENSFDAVLRTRPHGGILAANRAACALFGGSEEELCRLPRERLVDASDPRLARLMDERQRTGRAWGLVRLRRVDGSLFEAEISSNVYTDSDGQPSSSMIVRDVTERQRIAQQLQERQRLESIGTLAGGVAHDFNNMLAAILGNVALAAADLPAGAPARERLELAQRAADRARALVRQILTFSRRTPAEQRVQPLQPLVEEAVALLRATLPPRVTLEVDLEPEPLAVRIDGAQVHQVVLNLCTNAWQALQDAAGTVRIAVERVRLGTEQAKALGLSPGDHACLHVDDDGPGIDEAVRSRIFEPFFTTKPPGQGTGLGLAVVHGIVVESAGAIRVDSAPGRGTRVAVYLPLSPDAAAGPASPSPQALPALEAAGARVLYVDDDEVVALTAMALLRAAGHAVSWAADGAAALQRLRESPAGFDVVVTDYNMPGLSGTAVAEAVRVQAPETAVIVISGLLSDELQRQARDCGVAEVLAKEEMLEQLAGAVSRALAARVAPA